MVTLKGIVTLDSPLYIPGQALDCEYRSFLGGHEIRVFLPQLPIRPNAKGTESLMPPQACDANAPDAWGFLKSYHPTNYEPGSSCAAVQSIFIQCAVDDFALSCDAMQSSIDNWRIRLSQLLCLEKKYDYSYDGHATNPGRGIHLFTTGPASQKYTENLMGEITGLMIDLDDSLNQAQLEMVFLSLDLSRSLKLEYELLVHAYQELTNGALRYSLFQAISAVEICITNKLADLCVEKELDAKILVDKKTLGEKFLMLRDFGLRWPSKNPNSEITKLRNDLFHCRSVSPDFKTVKEVLRTVRVYLDHFSPGYFEQDH